MTYKLTYFDVSGRGDPIRYILKYGGINFEDKRIGKEDWPAFKPDTPFGQLPVLEYNGKIAHQSIAICRYVAKQAKLVGKDDWEDLEIDAAVDTCTDLFTKIFIGVSTKKETFKEQFAKEDIIYYLKKFDEQIKKNNGYLAVGRLTWADLVFVPLIIFVHGGDKEVLADYPNIGTLITKVQGLPGIKDYLASRPKTD